MQQQDNAVNHRCHIALTGKTVASQRGEAKRILWSGPRDFSYKILLMMCNAENDAVKRIRVLGSFLSTGLSILMQL
jgi:hypothetical protein